MMKVFQFHNLSVANKGPPSLLNQIQIFVGFILILSSLQLNVSTMKNHIILFICINFMFSCNISDLEENDIEKVVSTGITDEALSKFIIASGFDSTKVTDHGDFYLIEECIIIDKKALNEGRYDVLKQFPENAHARTTNLVGGNPGINKTIRVKIDSSIPTSGVDNWRTEIQQALQDYNSIRNFRLKFQLVTTGSYDILIRAAYPNEFGSIHNSVIAAASWPTNGNPGNSIAINLTFNNNWTVPSAVKRYNINHEIGHCLGFRHTNWSLVGEPANYPGYPDYPGAIHIQGTWDDVDGSVMNAGTPTHSWNGFNWIDALAFKTVYPYDAGERALYTYFNPIGAHTWSADWAEFGSAHNGYNHRAYTGFVLNYQKAGTVPLYRFQHQMWYTYYLSTNINLPSIDPSWSLDKTIGYVYTSPTPTTMPIYEFYNTTESHYFTMHYNDPWMTGPGWIGGNIAFYILF